MSKFLRLITFLAVSSLATSCLMPGDKGRVSLSLSSDDQAARDAGKVDHEGSSQITVSSIQLIDDKIIVQGSELDGVNVVKLTQSGADSTLSILSQTASKLILSSSTQVALALNTLMSLTLEDAYGATVVDVTFNLPDSSVSTAKIGDEQVTTAKIADGAITAVKLSSMSASVGQLLRWNGTTWVASDLDALTYAGTWNASGNPNPSAVGGEYYIVSTDGSNVDPGDGNPRDWFQGDWIVYNDNTSSWDQIRNSSDVSSFNTRTGAVMPQSGDYTWAMINKTTSSIGDIADVDLTTAPTTGKVLKFDGTSWVADDDLSGGGAGSVTSTEIANDSIVDADINSAAAISWSKIDKTGSTAGDVGLGNVTNDAQLKAADLDTTATLGTDDTKIPSQNAVKTYVDNAVTGMGSVTSITGGAGLTDGPITTTGTLDVRVDDSTIAIVSDILEIKDDGITNAKINSSAAIAWSKIDKTGATASDVGLGNVTNDAQLKASDLDTTTTLGTSDTAIPSQNAVKTYVDAQVGGVNQTQWTTTGSDIYYSTGNVGIGTSTPSTGLHIAGVNPSSGSLNLEVSSNGGLSSKVDFYKSRGTLGAPAVIPASEGIGRTSYFGYDGAAYQEGARVNVAASSGYGTDLKTTYSILTHNGNSLSERIVVDEDGLVGIGTNNPQGRLHIQKNPTGGDYGTGYNEVIIESSQLAVGMHISSAANGKTGFTFGDPTDADSGRLLYDHSDDSMTFSTNTTEKMRILSDGKVGIGTTTPTTELEVDGTITATGFNGPITSSTTTVSGGSAAAPSYTFSGDTDTGLYSGSADTIEVSVNGSNIFDFISDGLVSSTAKGAQVGSVAGTNGAPTYSFAGDTDTGWYSPADNQLAASVGGSEAVRITDEGSVGIGVSTPSSMLDVKGNALNAISGTVSITAGTSAVVGTGTAFSGELYEGDPISIAGEIHTIDTITDATNLTLTSTHTAGATNVAAYTDGYLLNIVSADDDQQLTVNNHGNVAIGHPNAMTKLDVRGVTRIRREDSHNQYFEFESGGAHIIRYMNKESNRKAAIYDNIHDETGSSGGGSDFIFRVGAVSSPTELVRIKESGDVGIGTNSPASKLEVAGVVTATGFSGPVTSSIVGADAGSAASPSFTFNSDTNSGFYSSGADSIGVSVNGSNIFDLSAAGITSSTTRGGVLNNTPGGQGAPTFSFKDDEDTGWFSPSADNLAASTAGSERVRITSNGYLGVGVTSPTGRLGGTGTNRIHLKSSNGSAELNIDHSGISNGHASGLTFSSSGTPVGSIVAQKSATSATDAHLVFLTHDGSSIAERMRLSKDGNLGIGTTSPSNPLAVEATNGVANAVIKAKTTGVNSSATISLFNDAQNWVLKTAGNDNFGITDQTAAADRLTIAKNGYIGLGEAAPDRMLIIGDNEAIKLSDANDITSESDILFKNGGVISAGAGMYINADADNTGSGNIVFGKGSETNGSSPLMTIQNGGNVGIGVTGPSEKLHVNGNILSAAYLYTSDRRFKKNIERIPASLDKVSQMRGVSFDWRNDEFPERMFPEERTMGFIAQEVEEVAPELVKTSADGYKSVQYGNITALLVEAIKEIKNQIVGLFSNDEKLERKISSLEKENEELRREMEEIKKGLKELKQMQKAQRDNKEE